MISTGPQDAHHVHALHDIGTQLHMLALDARRLHVSVHVSGGVRTELSGHVINGADEPGAIKLLPKQKIK